MIIDRDTKTANGIVRDVRQEGVCSTLRVTRCRAGPPPLPCCPDEDDARSDPGREPGHAEGGHGHSGRCRSRPGPGSGLRSRTSSCSSNFATNCLSAFPILVRVLGFVHVAEVEETREVALNSFAVGVIRWWSQLAALGRSLHRSCDCSASFVLAALASISLSVVRA